tara:strand:- start:88 stop:468 length:381 start_codon:yes stop_codon:yes gene_type:complete
MTLLTLIFSLTGIFFGYLLTRIAPEELKSGRKYFVLIKRILFILISVFVSFYFIQYVSLLVTLIFVVLFILVFVLQLKIKKTWTELFPFVIFLSSVIFYSEQNFYLVLSSLMFIYGLPVGSLLKKL